MTTSRFRLPGTLTLTVFLHLPADYAITHYLLTNGGTELNPIANYLIYTHSWNAFLTYKTITITAFTTYILYGHHHDHTTAGHPQHTLTRQLLLYTMFLAGVYIITNNILVLTRI